MYTSNITSTKNVRFHSAICKERGGGLKFLTTQELLFVAFQLEQQVRFFVFVLFLINCGVSLRHKVNLCVYLDTATHDNYTTQTVPTWFVLVHIVDYFTP